MPSKLLRLNLQHFAESNQGQGENGEQNPTDPQQDQQQGQGESNTGDNPEDQQGEQQGRGEGKVFTEEQVNAIVQERLERDRKKQEQEKQRERDEAERKRLEENEEYKELAEKRQEEIERLRQLQEEQKQEALNAKKKSLLSQAGYTEEQTQRYVKYLEGETDEEINASLETLKSDVPPAPTFADPSPGNGRKQEPEKKDLRDEGKSMYQRLKEKGKVKGKK